MGETPLILWFRRDLRLGDQPMLAAAAASGRALLPVVILDPETEAIGAAPKWRWGLAVGAFARALEELGVRLVLRRGPALEVLYALWRLDDISGMQDAVVLQTTLCAALDRTLWLCESSGVAEEAQSLAGSIRTLPLT